VPPYRALAGAMLMAAKPNPGDGPDGGVTDTLRAVRKHGVTAAQRKRDGPSVAETTVHGHLVGALKMGAADIEDTQPIAPYLWEASEGIAKLLGVGKEDAKSRELSSKEWAHWCSVTTTYGFA
jgi:hypothetical protein